MDQPLPFEVEVFRDGERSIVVVRGEIDLATVDGVRDAIQEATTAGDGDVWVDLSDVGFIDSTGLSALVGGHRALTDSRHRLAVICPDGPALRALEVSGLDEVLQIYRDLSEAGTDGA